MRWVACCLLFALAGVAAGCDAASPPPTPISVPATGICAGIPVYPQDQALATSLPLTPDPSLEAEFPPQIDGQPLTDLTSARYTETLCALGGEASLLTALTDLPPGVDLEDVRVASAQASVDNKPVTISAFRLPNHSGDELLTVVGVLSQSVAPSAARFASFVPTSMGGGKDAVEWINAADGSISYLYAAGDTLFIVDGANASQADKVLSALP